MEINIGISECDKNVDNYYGRNIGSHTAPAERLSTVSSLFMVIINKISMLYIFLGNWVYQNKLQQQNPKFTMPSIGSLQYLLRSRLRERRQWIVHPCPSYLVHALLHLTTRQPTPSYPTYLADPVSLVLMPLAALVLLLSAISRSSSQLAQ